MELPSKACCTIPPVEAEYTPIGTYETLGDMKANKTGPVDATAAIFTAINAQVYMPDFLNGEVADHSWLTPDREEKIRAFSAFIQCPASIPCAVVTSQFGAKSPFVAAAGSYPSFMSLDNATITTISFCILPSKDGDQETCMSFVTKFKVNKQVETFTDMAHEWMAARANLRDTHCKAEFERGCSVVGSYLKKYLSQDE